MLAREGATAVIAELDEEYYLHYAGHKDTLDLKALYESYPDLSALDQAQALGDAAGADSGISELWRFASENYLAELTREHAEKSASLEAQLEATVDGETIGYRMIRPTIANEEDGPSGSGSRGAPAHRGHISPIHVDGFATLNEAVPRLGRRRTPTCTGASASGSTARRPVPRRPRVDRGLREGGGQAVPRRAGSAWRRERWDVAGSSTPAWDEAFPAKKMMPALEVSLADLGIDLRSQQNVELDIEQRPKKSPRAFCAPIEVPGRVVLVIQPMGGADDWRALFHEAGHTEHYAHVNPDLPVEARRLGDVSVTEAWATLMEHFLLEPGWLASRLDFPRPDEFAAEAAAGSLYLLRRYCGTLLYELEFHAATELDEKAMSSRYVELLGSAVKIEPSPTDYLGDIDSSFYVTGYLRSWALQAQLRNHFRDRFGSAWFSNREAGSMLRELWGEGSRLNADELLADVAGEELEMEAFAESLRELLK
jgi:hypothetical protein